MTRDQATRTRLAGHLQNDMDHPNMATTNLNAAVSLRSGLAKPKMASGVRLRNGILLNPFVDRNWLGAKPPKGIRGFIPPMGYRSAHDTNPIREAPGRTTATAVPAGRFAMRLEVSRVLWAKEIITQPAKG